MASYINSDPAGTGDYGVDTAKGDQLYKGTSAPPAAKDFDYQALLTGSRAPSLESVNPYTDSSYNNFYRGMGLDRATIGAQKAKTNANLQGQLDAQRPVWAEQLSRGLKTIGDSAENNGVFRSGQRLTNQNEFQTDQNRAQAGFEGGIHNAMGEADANASLQLQALARQQAEQELAARARVAQTQMQNQTNPVLQQLLMQALQG